MAACFVTRSAMQGDSKACRGGGKSNITIEHRCKHPYGKDFPKIRV